MKADTLEPLHYKDSPENGFYSLKDSPVIINLSSDHKSFLLFVHGDKLFGFYLNKKTHSGGLWLLIIPHWFHDKSLPSLFAQSSSSSSRSTEGPADLVLGSPLNLWPLQPLGAAFWLKARVFFLFLDWLPLKSFISYLHVFLSIAKTPWNLPLLFSMKREVFIIAVNLFGSFLWLCLTSWKPLGTAPIVSALFLGTEGSLLIWICSQNPLRLVHIPPPLRHEIHASCQNCSPKACQLARERERMYVKRCYWGGSRFGLLCKEQSFLTTACVLQLNK